MARPRRAWSKTVDESGISIRVYERAPGSVLYREVRLEGGEKDRKSLGHRDRRLAERQAHELAKRLAELRLTGQVSGVALGPLVQLYMLHRAPLLSVPRRARVKAFAEYFLRHFGETFAIENLSQTHVDAYAQARRSGALASAKRRGKETTVRAGTVRAELNWLAALIHWGRSFKVSGRRLLAANPLDGVRLLQEKNPRRPVASEERYRRTLEHADKADPRGRLACLLALARFTGRRINAICQLRASDVLLSREAVLRALAAGGQDERQADYMPQGAIRWRAVFDKQGFEELTALSSGARAALERYLRLNPRLGEAPLFPSTTDETRPAGKLMAEYWLIRAEKLAGVAKLERGAWHPYRRLWAMERKHHSDVDVAKAGGWRDLATMKRAYQVADPATVLNAVENAPTGHKSDTPSEPSRGVSIT